ncbi:MAG: 5-formyltetrahydrofolate cyclo-ligase [Alphaproteobacteria bacterium]
MTLAEAKKALRKVSLERRRAAHRAGGLKAAAAARDRFLEAITLAPRCTVSGYWPIRDELDIRPLLCRLHEAGHRCALPVIVGRRRPLVFRVWSPNTPMEEAAFGISVPTRTAPEVVPEVLIVPLLAFDPVGYRLGYGGGYYDVTLTHLRAERSRTLAVGMAFEAQRVDLLPHGPDDQRLDWVVTERRALRTRDRTHPLPRRERGG